MADSCPERNYRIEVSQPVLLGGGGHEPEELDLSPDRPDYVTTDGTEVWIERKRQKTRFLDARSRQVGPVHRNLAPAIAWARTQGWRDPSLPQWFNDGARARGRPRPPRRRHETTSGGDPMGPTVNRCASPGCRAVIEPRPTGRPARYCGAACRQAAHRDRVRAAENAAELAARLAGAKAARARLARPLEVAGFRTVPDAAANVYASAADPGLDAADLDQSLAQLRLAVDELAVLARAYRHAADEAELAPAVRAAGRGTP